MPGQINENVLFKGMPKDEVSNCLDCCSARVIECDKNEILFSQGDKPKYLYIVIEGSVILCRDTNDGKRTITAEILQDDIVGEVNIVLEDKPYNFYAITTKPSKLLQIPKEDFFKTCTRACVSNSAVIHNLMQVLARKADTLSSRVQLLSTGSLRQRVSKYLVENSDEQFNVELKMNREQLAEYLNVTRPALSKELLTMQSEGLIALEKHKVIIKNFNSLAENT